MECEEKNKGAEGKKQLGFRSIRRGFGCFDGTGRSEPVARKRENNCWCLGDRRGESFRVIRIILEVGGGRLAYAGW